MSYRITKDFALSAAHHLDGLADDHPCSRVHGHNYLIRVQLSAPLLDNVGMVFDYNRLRPFGEWLDRTLDHQDLNAVADCGNPTAENLARHLAVALITLCGIERTIDVAVGVSETPKTWAWFES
jgi:6-pyruvoyltetrahydropterin/6-carboxytetrahydropterin synthase